MDIKYYKKLRNRYTPEQVKLIFLLESPPMSGKYFYDIDGEVTEPLFKAMMKLMSVTVKSKSQGLEKFMEEGYLIVDSTYTAVNSLSPPGRNKIIENNFVSLLADLEKLDCKDIIAIKKNVGNLLAKKLADNGFNVLNFKNNQLITVPFPSHGWQKEFQIIISGLL